MNDRIKLAEAMDWYINGNRWENKHLGEERHTCPDPFTDANDDYSVLEWARTRWDKSGADWCEFWFDLNHAGSYQIGDYARAALKVLP